MIRVLLLLSACAYSAAAQTPAFEVASVKLVAEPKIPPMMPAANRCSGGPGTKKAGKYECNETSLKGLIAAAYQVPASRISGPDFLDSARYMVDARLEPETTPENFRLMLQALLAERFELKLHRETKSTPVYVLTVAKNGHKLQPPREAPQYASDEERKAAMQASAQKQLEAMKARTAAGGPKSFNWTNLGKGTVAAFAQQISGRVDREIIDRTGITGEYSFDLSWTNDVDPAGEPTLFGAMQEQLGLKLTPAREEIEILLVDHAMRTPAGN